MFFGFVWKKEGRIKKKKRRKKNYEDISIFIFLWKSNKKTQQLGMIVDGHFIFYFYFYCFYFLFLLFDKEKNGDFCFVFSFFFKMGFLFCFFAL